MLIRFPSLALVKQCQSALFHTIAVAVRPGAQGRIRVDRYITEAMMDRDGMEELADPDRLTFTCKDEMRTTVTRFDQASEQ
ncbi:hypothetical protein CF135_16240 [Aeromonas veronii]|nr:hypothetical protein CF135_16240 [Aeromonas veronii]